MDAVRDLVAFSLTSTAAYRLAQPRLHRLVRLELAELAQIYPDSGRICSGPCVDPLRLTDHDWRRLETLKRFELVCRSPTSVSRLSATTVRRSGTWSSAADVVTDAFWVQAADPNRHRYTLVSTSVDRPHIYSSKPSFLDALSANITNLEICNLDRDDFDALASLPRLKSVSILSTSGRLPPVISTYAPITSLKYCDYQRDVALLPLLQSFPALTSLTLHLNWPLRASPAGLRLDLLPQLTSLIFVDQAPYSQPRDEQFLFYLEATLSWSFPLQGQSWAFHVTYRAPGQDDDLAALSQAVEFSGLFDRVGLVARLARVASLTFEAV
ncbi:hypothetical protein JCM8097_005830 [Rhodosporidiobolus ruineniae]